MTAPPFSLFRPRLPDAEAVAPYLRRIDEARWYTNFGPLHEEFRARLADRLGVEAESVALVSSGTTAIAGALVALDLPAGTRVACPAFTFAATAVAIRLAGLEPYFVDVEATTWALNPARVRELAEAGEIGAAVPVAVFGAAVDVKAWAALRRDTGLAVVLDAAGAFDALSPSELPAAVSLHATKPLGVGEGGFVVCRDPGVIERIRHWSNFGLGPDRLAVGPGANAKLSEYAAAVGLAGLDGWDETRNLWRTLAARYAERLTTIDGVTTAPGFGTTATTICAVRLSGPAAPVARALAEWGIESRSWWPASLTDMPEFVECRKDDARTSEGLADSVLGLPLSVDMTGDDIDRVVAALTDAAPA